MDYGGKRGKNKGKKKSGNVTSSEIYWYEKSNKNKWHIYLSTCGVKLVCTLSFTFEGNCETNLKALLECMNRQYFPPFYTKIKKEKLKF